MCVYILIAGFASSHCWVERSASLHAHDTAIISLCPFTLVDRKGLATCSCKPCIVVVTHHSMYGYKNGYKSCGLRDGGLLLLLQEVVHSNNLYLGLTMYKITQ